MGRYHTPLKTLGAIGLSAMMHGYLAFDKDGSLLVPCCSALIIRA